MKSMRLRPTYVRLATTLLALAAVAASCLPPDIESRVDGSIRLDPAHRRWSRNVEFSVNEAALESGGRIIVGLGYQSKWSEGFHDGPDVIGALTPIEAINSVDRAKYDDQGCVGPDCVGRYRATFRWLPELQSGYVDVDWSVTGYVVFEDVPVADDAWVSVTLV